MSVNIDLTVTVTELTSTEQADAVVEALSDVLRGHGIERDVVLDVLTNDGRDFTVLGTTPYTFSVSRSYAWTPKVEGDFATAVTGAAPAAKLVVDWKYVD